jgi:anti-sigma factor RsiW
MSKDRDYSLDESLPLDADGSADFSLLRCEDIQMLLFAYMTRELGDVQSRVVRDHLLSCDACRQEAAEIEETLSLLRADSDAPDATTLRLSDERRERLWRAVFHPVLDWIDRHHRLVAGVTALVVLLLTLFLLRHAAIWKRQQFDDSIPIWRMFRSGSLPAAVEKAREEEQERIKRLESDEN